MRPPIKNRRYPPGFRFVPTDAEVLKHLEMKIANPQYECPMITSTDVSQHTPEELVNLYRPKGEDICYFFTSRNRKYQKGTRPNRVAKGGFYKASGVDKPVMDKNGKIIGSRRSLVYQSGTHQKSTKTSWLMTEYLIDKYQRPIDTQSNSMMLDELVICKVYFNTQKRKKSQPEQEESSESQRGSEYEAAGHTEGENQMVVSTNCSKEVQGLGDMMNSMEQVMVENKMGKSVDKGKGPLIYCNDPAPLSWDIPADPSCPSTSLGSYDKCYDKNFYASGQFNNNLDSWPNGGDMISQYTQVHGGPCFDGSENGGMYPNGYGCGYDEQLLNMVLSNDQHNSLNNDGGCSFISQCAERDGNKFDNSLTSRSNGDNIGYDGQLANMQFNDQLHSLNNDGGCSFDFQSATGDGNQLQFDNNLTSQSISNNIGYDLQFADMQFDDQLTLNKDGGSIINFQSFIGDDNNLGYDYDPQLADTLFDDLFNSMNEEGGCVQLQFPEP